MRTLGKVLAICSGFWLFGLHSATAADIQAQTVPENDGTKINVITVDGDIEDGDDQKFADLAIRVTDAVVMLNSPGGNLMAGIAIGQAIRVKEFPTLVPSGFSCASACALAWLGGRTRYMAAGSTIGFHAASLSIDPSHSADSVANALVGAYLNSLGLPTAAIAYITQPQPEDIRWLTFDDAEKLGIEVKPFELDSSASNRSVSNNDSPHSTTPTDQPLPSYAPAQPNAPDSTQPPPGRTQWTSYGEWIQLYSRPSAAIADQLAETYRQRFVAPHVFYDDNGWYAGVVGPYPTGTATLLLDRYRQAGLVPRDSLVVQGAHFVNLVWGDQPSPQTGTGDADKAYAIAQAFFDLSSFSTNDALSLLNVLYSDEVTYFGKKQPKRLVLRKKQDFMDRWPTRSYAIRPSTIAAECTEAGICTVTGVVDWRAHSDSRTASSQGTAAFELRFSTMPILAVLSESSRVLTRDVRAQR